MSVHVCLYCGYEKNKLLSLSQANLLCSKKCRSLNIIAINRKDFFLTLELRINDKIDIAVFVLPINKIYKHKTEKFTQLPIKLIFEQIFTHFHFFV